MRTRVLFSRKLALIGAIAALMNGCGGSQGFETVAGDDSTFNPESSSIDPNSSGTVAPNDDTIADGPEGTDPVEAVGECPECDTNGWLLTDESFTQAGQQSRPLDILLVVDNSGSMSEEQAKLSNLSPLMDFIKETNWRVAVASTAASENYFREALESVDTSKSFAEKKQRFSDVILGLGINGSGNEQGITQAYNSVIRNNPNGSGTWVRNDSFLSIIVVSDEDECSNGANCGASNAQLLSRVENTLGKTAITDFKFSSLIKPDAASCPQAYNVGNRYKAMSESTGGLVSAICSNSYEDFLESIAADLSIEIEHGFQLAHMAKKVVSIELNGAEFTGTYVFKNQVIVLDPLPQAGDQVTVRYAHE